MSNHATKAIADDLTSVRITDRLAKVAVAFTGGRVSIVYGSPPETDSKGQIFLPSECRAVALGTYRADTEKKVDFEALTWAYVNHEMGHLDVEFKLRYARSRRIRAHVHLPLYELVPIELREVAVSPGGPIVLPSELVIDANGARLTGQHIAKAYGGNAFAASGQFFFLCNAAEDPRQEAMTSARWKGAAEHLEYSNSLSRARWRESATDLIASGEDRTFRVFAVALLEAILGDDISWAGKFVGAQIDAVRDIIDEYRRANWIDAHGVFDAINFALAVIGRIYRKEPIPERPSPEEDERECNEDGEGDESENEPEGEEQNSPEPPENDDSNNGEEPTSNAENDEGEEEKGDRDSSGESEDAEPTPDEGDEGAPAEDDETKSSEDDEGDGSNAGGNEDENEDNAGEDGAEDGDGPGDCEDSGSDSDNSEESGDDDRENESSEESDKDENTTKNDEDLKVGSIVRPKGSEIRYKVTAVNTDGSVEAEPLTRDQLTEAIRTALRGN